MSDKPIFSPAVIKAAEELTTRFPFKPFHEEQVFDTCQVIQEAVDANYQSLRAEVGEQPQWMDRPNQPGMWVCIGGKAGGIEKLQDAALHLMQADLDRGAPFCTVRVYGPIPDFRPTREIPE